MKTWQNKDRQIYEGAKHIATAHYGFAEVDHIVADANAQLIAAAPELLEALQSMVKNYQTPENGTAANHAFVNACKAIAKATGEKEEVK